MAQDDASGAEVAVTPPPAAGSCWRSDWRWTQWLLGWWASQCSAISWGPSAADPRKPGFCLARSSVFPPGKPDWRRMRIPSALPGTGRRHRSPAGSDDSKASSSRCLLSTARTSAARCAGSRSHGCSCAPAMAGCTMRTAHTPPDRRHVACTSMTTRSAMASSGSRADGFRRSPNPYESEDNDAPHLCYSQLV